MPVSVSDSKFIPYLVNIFVKIKNFRINMFTIIPCFEGVEMVNYYTSIMIICIKIKTKLIQCMV